MTQTFAIFSNNLIRFPYGRQLVQLLPFLAIIWLKLFQVHSEQKVFDAVIRVFSGSMDLFKSFQPVAYLKALHMTVLILVNFVQASKRDHRGSQYDEVCDILQHILEACKAPFQGSPPSSSHYAPPIDSMLAFFPPLPKLVGPANYFADST